MESQTYTIGIIGIGVLGTAIKETFASYNTNIISNIICYDKYKKIGNNILDTCICDIIFICLPTEYNDDKKEYDKSEIYNVFEELSRYNYKGYIILKSTVEPKTTIHLSFIFNNLNIIHSPEFLSARTAIEDFKNQKHIVLGLVGYIDKINNINSYTNSNININSVNSDSNINSVNNDSNINSVNNIKDNVNNDIFNLIEIAKYLKTFFTLCFPLAKISICSSTESESMKIFCNSFYATKIQFFTETKLLCDKLEIDYNNVKDLMLSNNWINPMHTQVPGHDGKLSFGGKCLPKDINALNEFCKKLDVPNKVLEAVIQEHKQLRKNDYE